MFSQGKIIQINHKDSFKKTLLLKVLILIVIIFMLNTLAMKFYWYSALWWFDMPMHFLGGVWVGLFSSWLIIFSGFFKHVSMSEKRFITAVLLLVFVIGLGWECFEFTVQYLIPGSQLANPLDSLSDLFFDCAGGATALLYILHKKYYIL